MLCSRLIKISNPHCLAESCWLLLITMILLRELGYKTVPLTHTHTHDTWVLIGVKSFQLTLCKAQEMRVQPLGVEDPLEEEIASHSSISCLQNSMDRGAWPVTVYGVTKSQTRLSDWACTPKSDSVCFLPDVERAVVIPSISMLETPLPSFSFFHVEFSKLCPCLKTRHVLWQILKWIAEYSSSFTRNDETSHNREEMDYNWTNSSNNIIGCFSNNFKIMFPESPGNKHFIFLFVDWFLKYM